MSDMKFKKGDRVVVYGIVHSGSKPHGTWADQRRLAVVNLVLTTCILGTFDDGREFSANAKQCRRLVNKLKQRIWLVSDSIAPWSYIPPIQEDLHRFREFVEVRKKK